MAASPMTSGSLGRPDPAAALIRIALQLGATSVAHVDVAAMLSGACVAMPPAAGVSGAAMALIDPADPRDPDEQRIFSSDTTANRMALIQQRAGSGPLATHGDRTVVTPDLTRCDPPELASAAATNGLVRSLVLPIPVAGHTVGGLALFGRRDAVLDEQLATLLRPVVTMLAARLADVRELARWERLATDRRPGTPTGAPADTPTDDPDRTTRLSTHPLGDDPAGRIPRQPGATAGPHDDGHTTSLPRVPAQRRGGRVPPHGPGPGAQDPVRRPRHRRPDDE